MYAKNYRKRSLFEKVMAKIKRCSFFAPQCRCHKCTRLVQFIKLLTTRRVDYILHVKISSYFVL